MNTRHIILGLLAQEPMSGYDIKSLFSGLSWMIGTPSYGSLYPTLHALLEEHLLDVSVEPGDGKPSRKLYSVTQAGREYLDAWLKESAIPESSIKAFIHQLIVAGNFSPDELKDHLTQRRSQVVDFLEAPDDSPQGQEQLAGNLGKQLVRDYGLAIARAELAWLDAQLAGLG
ncbi:MAG: PadR family transcriptional regulator [Anaerolineae bacterium]|nr:PadR family transcriptional regulator [Anaerolineae bacterium]